MESWQVFWYINKISLISSNWEKVQCDLNGTTLNLEYFLDKCTYYSLEIRVSCYEITVRPQATRFISLDLLGLSQLKNSMTFSSCFLSTRPARTWGALGLAFYHPHSCFPSSSSCCSSFSLFSGVGDPQALFPGLQCWNCYQTSQTWVCSPDMQQSQTLMSECGERKWGSIAGAIARRTDG